MFWITKNKRRIIHLMIIGDGIMMVPSLPDRKGRSEDLHQSGLHHPPPDTLRSRFESFRD